MADTQSRDQAQNLAAGAAAGAGLLAIVAAFATRRAPRWVRVTVILGLLAIACGAGIYAYRYSKQPTTLTVVAGSLDGDAPKLMEAIAARLEATNAPVRLKVIDELTAANAAAAFAAGKADLAVIRPDVGDLSSARSLMIVARAVVLIIATPGSNVTSMDDLKGKTVGVVGGSINHSVVRVLTKEYDLERVRTRFRDILPAEVPQAVQAKQVQALLLVVPISEQYIGRIRDMLRGTKGKFALVPIESAGAIANIQRAYESYELPKGTIRGSPAVPDEDLTTLRMPLYLVAGKKVSDDVAGTLVKAVFDARRRTLEGASAVGARRRAGQGQGCVHSYSSRRGTVFRGRAEVVLRQVRRSALLRLDAARHAGHDARRCVEIHDRRRIPNRRTGRWRDYSR